MSYPLVTGTYTINGRNYRKPPSRNGKVATTEVFQDTPDIYEMEDEPTVGCFAPPVSSIKKMVDKKTNKEDNTVGKDPIKKNKDKEAAHKQSSEEFEECEDPRIKVINGNKWVASVFIPEAFMGKFVGMNRRNLKNLEEQTLCRVKTPRKDEIKPCEITSLMGIEPVQRCLDRIEIFLDDARKSSRVTHFVAFPCEDSEVVQNFEMFRDTIMSGNDYDATCKKPDLFMRSSRLHLTCAVGWIFDENDMNKIKNAFAKIEEEVKTILGSNQFIIDIQGVDMMNDDPSSVSVLFAKVRGEYVQKIANLIRNRMVECGIGEAKECEEDVKLHMTLMNGRYVAQAEKLKSYTFDATKIFDLLKDFYFGTTTISEIVLCPLNSNTPTDGFYKKLITINLA